MRFGERGHLVVDEPGGPSGLDHVHVAEGGRLALARDDPDRAVRDDPLAKGVEAGQGFVVVGREEDEVGLGRRFALGDVLRPLSQLIPKRWIRHAEDGDPHAGPHTELVEQGRRVGLVHRLTMLRP
jgi:hypothetical protein